MAFDTTYDVFRAWKDKCLDKDGSLLFDDKQLWTEKNLQTVFDTMEANPLPGEGTLKGKLRKQFKDYDQRHGVWLLLVEMLALHYSPFTRVKKETKVKKETLAIELCEGFPEYSNLQEKAQALEGTEGFVRAGQSFYRNAYIGIVYYARFALEYKKSGSALRDLVKRFLAGEPCWSEAELFSADNIIGAKVFKRQSKTHYPRVMRHMFCPKYYYDIYSGEAIGKIIKEFSKECNIPDDDEITEHEKIYRIGEVLMNRDPELKKRYSEGDQLVDFYSEPLKSRWSSKSNKGVGEKTGKYDNGNTNGKDTSMSNHPLNQILYGPPGTGKTYHTVNHALAILEQKSLDEIRGEGRDALRERYEEYRKEGRVEMITFHQNFVYEDFVEGIKPTLKDDSGTLRYELSDGIFKKLVEKANDSSRGINIAALLEDYATKVQGMLDASESVDLDPKPDRKSGAMLTKVNRDNKEAFRSFTVGGTVESHPSLASGIIKRDYENFYAQKITRYQDIKPKNETSTQKYHGNATYYFWLFQRLQEFQEKSGSNYETQQDADKPASYVLIIDEINRGNIAKIFGELITLLEEDKRDGNAEKATVTLPYSNDKFSVPNNLYIIGTMNTADRSIALLDTALRRRFTFTEMMPKPSLLEDEVVEGVRLRELLTKINGRIRELLDRDHQIGHSYFMSVETLDKLKNVFQTKVLPLLQEYFYDDWGKISEVLNHNGFITEDEDIYELLQSDDPKWDDPQSYRQIIGDAPAGDPATATGDSANEDSATGSPAAEDSANGDPS